MQPLHGFETRGLWACRLWVDLEKFGGSHRKHLVDVRGRGCVDLPQMLLALLMPNSLLARTYVHTNWT